MPHVMPLHADDPQRVGRYRLTGRIAEIPADGPAYFPSARDGVAVLPADGAVYLGSTPDGGEVAVKLLDGDWDGAARDRFTAEAQAASRVAPFCAAQILDAGFEGDQAYLVSEYVAGPSLEEFVAEEGPWEGRDLMALAIGTATGLAAIHQAGLVHGDFGPEHVVLSARGPRVVGFGITPPYGSATPAADLRAWVHTMLYAAAGETADPEDPEYLDLLPEPLRPIAVRCIFAQTGGQPTARSIVLELLGEENPPAGVLGEGMRRAARAGVRSVTPPDEDPAPPPAAAKRRARAAWWVAGVAACLVAIAAVILFVQHQGSQSSDAAKSPASDAPAASPSAGRPTPRPTPAVNVPAALAGTWSGQVSQTSPNGSADVFQAEVTLTAGASQGSVQYSGASGASFSCTGHLAPVSDSSGTLTLHQAIAQGPCAGGEVTLSPGSGNTLRFRFTGKHGPMTTGTLTRS
jgi:eukaryotic-like serine/threonine-protein kinase